MRVQFGGTWIADSEEVLLLFEPGRYPMAYFPEAHIPPNTLQRTDYTTRHPDLGQTSWYTVRAGERSAARGAWQHIELPAYASDPRARVAFAWPAMDAFYEEDERIMGHAADSYHRIGIRQASRTLMVRHGDRVIADTSRPVVLYESGFAPRWYVERADIDESALTPVEHQTFCPYKGLCSYYDIGDARLAAWVVSRRLSTGRPDLQPGVVRAGHRFGTPRRQTTAARAGPDGDSTRSRSRPRRLRGAAAPQPAMREKPAAGSRGCGEKWLDYYR
jgi:uncharacterized protein (DUF427 family)